jgi:hypothetical protein
MAPAPLELAVWLAIHFPDAVRAGECGYAVETRQLLRVFGDLDLLLRTQWRGEGGTFRSLRYAMAIISRDEGVSHPHEVRVSPSLYP